MGPPDRTDQERRFPRAPANALDAQAIRAPPQGRRPHPVPQRGTDGRDRRGRLPGGAAGRGDLGHRQRLDRRDHRTGRPPPAHGSSSSRARARASRSGPPSATSRPMSTSSPTATASCRPPACTISSARSSTAMRTWSSARARGRPAEPPPGQQSRQRPVLADPALAPQSSASRTCCPVTARSAGCWSRACRSRRATSRSKSN